MRILLTGPTGQVGSALLRTLPALGEVIAAGRSQLNLLHPETIRQTVRTVQPNVIVNAAAYTAVDQAESEESAAVAANGDGPAILSDEAKKLGALLVHFSTDYVFDGEKSSPYVETDEPKPLNAYGRSKLKGEQAIRDSRCRHLILRTSWVYSETGKNFLIAILRLAREAKELRVVDDQRGAPTSSRMIAEAVPEAVLSAWHDASLSGLYHMSAAGSTTWCGFARAILGDERRVRAIPSSDFATLARRPRNSVLDNGKLAAKLGIRLPSWRAGMQSIMARLHESGA